MKKEDKQQFTLRITQANPTELVVILYEMMLCYLDDAEAALGTEEGMSLPGDPGAAASRGEKDPFHEAVRKARGCLYELVNSLNPNYEPAPELWRLYMFCIRRLALSELRRDGGLLDEIRRVVRPLCDAYRQIAGQNTAGPVMNNSQTVYAGLTYGRGMLTEDMADQGANRGIFA